MQLEITTELVGLTILSVSNLIAFVWLISSLSSRVKTLEHGNEVLFKNDKLHDDELKTLNVIKGQLEVLISLQTSKKIS